jgi:hypothetical protein
LLFRVLELQRQVEELGIGDDALRLVGQREAQDFGRDGKARHADRIEIESARQRIFLALDRESRRRAGNAAARGDLERAVLADLGHGDEAVSDGILRAARRQPLAGLDAAGIGDHPANFQQDFVLAWRRSFFDRALANAHTSDGLVHDPEQNARLGQILAMIQEGLD